MVGFWSRLKPALLLVHLLLRIFFFLIPPPLFPKCLLSVGAGER